jgi:copper chaperone NosL
VTRDSVACQAALALTLAACSRGPAQPSAVDTRSDTCAFCRMMVSDVRFAGQLAAPGEEPRFFDDLGCLRDYLKGNPRLPRGSVAFVADHQTGEWVSASRAQFTRSESLRTPMSSHLIAHAGQASRDGDPAAAGGTLVPAAELFGPQGPPDGTP